MVTAAGPCAVDGSRWQAAAVGSGVCEAKAAARAAKGQWVPFCVDACMFTSANVANMSPGVRSLIINCAYKAFELRRHSLQAPVAVSCHCPDDRHVTDAAPPQLQAAAHVAPMLRPAQPTGQVPLLRGALGTELQLLGPAGGQVGIGVGHHHHCVSCSATV